MNPSESVNVSTFAIPTEDKVRYKRMFDTFDTNNDGKIDICDICGALQRAYAVYGGTEVNADIIYEMANKHPGSRLTFREFVLLMDKVEEDLEIMFLKFDEDINVEDVQTFFKDYKVQLTEQEAGDLIKTLAKDDAKAMALDELTKVHIFQYFTTAEDVAVFWRQSTTVDKEGPGAWWKILMAGAIAGMVAKTVTAPIERIRICYQVHGQIYGKMGARGAVYALLADGGPKSLWRSNGISLVKLLPDSVIRFLVYEKIRRLSDGDDSVKRKFWAGSVSGAVSQSVIYPLEVLKVKIAVSRRKQYLNVLDCVTRMYRKGGMRAFYSGYWTSMAGIVPYAGVDLATYETLINSYHKKYPDKSHLGTCTILAFGTFSSMLGQMLSYPLSLLRSKLQAGVDGRNSIEICRNVYRAEGMRGFYRGLLPSLIKVVPAGGISYVLYEEIKLALSLV